MRIKTRTHTSHSVCIDDMEVPLEHLPDNELRRHLNAADSILSEVRHYAVAVEDIRNTVKDANEQADLIRQADDRLLMFLAPKSF